MSTKFLILLDAAMRIVTEMNIAAIKNVKQLTEAEEAAMRESGMESISAASSVLEVAAQMGRDTNKIK